MNIFEVTTEGVIYVPKPDWRVKEPRPEFTYSDPDTYSVTFEPYIDEAMQKMWAIEEEYLTSVVVELLRDRGYTVIEPGLNTL